MSGESQVPGGRLVRSYIARHVSLLSGEEDLIAVTLQRGGSSRTLVYAQVPFGETLGLLCGEDGQVLRFNEGSPVLARIPDEFKVVISISALSQVDLEEPITRRVVHQVSPALIVLDDLVEIMFGTVFDLPTEAWGKLLGVDQIDPHVADESDSFEEADQPVYPGLCAEAAAAFSRELACHFERVWELAESAVDSPDEVLFVGRGLRSEAGPSRLAPPPS